MNVGQIRLLVRVAGLVRSCSTKAAVVRGPSPGPGRSTWVRHTGAVVYTVAYPAGGKAMDGVASQTRKALASLDERLAEAGTDKTQILEATVFLADMSTFQEMDQVWVDYIPEGSPPSRATVGVDLGGEILVEMKITASVP